MAWVTGHLRSVGSQDSHSLICQAADVLISDISSIDQNNVEETLEYLDAQESNLLTRQNELNAAVLNLTTAISELPDYIALQNNEQEVIVSSNNLTTAASTLTSEIAQF